VADLIQLKRAKYQGVEFAFISMPSTGGNRIIKIRFPGSNKQSIEVQGELPFATTLTAVIPHENYYTERDNLLRVLKNGLSGVLVHPTFGDVENVINGQYTLDETITQLGRATITIPFEVDDAIGIPIESGNLAAQVQTASDLLNTQLETDLGGLYDVSLNAPGNFADASNNLSNVASAFSLVSEFTNAVAEKAASFQAEIDAFSGSINDLIRSPADMATSIASLFESVDNLFETPGETFGALRSLFNFGDDDPVVEQTTVGRTQRVRNRDLIRSNMKTQALSFSYVNAALDDYESSEVLDEAQTDLETQYLGIRNDQVTKTSPTGIAGLSVTEPLTNEAFEELDRVRVQAQKTLADASITTPAIITVETESRPLSALLYDYYGNTDLFDTIAELNNIKMNAFVEGDVRILTV